jgi:hypothetical protein
VAHVKCIYTRYYCGLNPHDDKKECYCKSFEQEDEFSGSCKYLDCAGAFFEDDCKTVDFDGQFLVCDSLDGVVLEVDDTDRIPPSANNCYIASLEIDGEAYVKDSELC